MIQVRRFVEKTVRVMNPDGTLLIDRADENTFNDIRCQIAQQRLLGYTYVFEGNVGTINEKGECSQWFSGMFDLEETFLTKLFILSRDTIVDTKHLDDKIDKSVLKLRPQLNKRKKTIITNIESEDDFDFAIKYFDLEITHQKWNNATDVLVIGENWWDVSNTAHLYYNTDYNGFGILDINKLR